MASLTVGPKFTAMNVGVAIGATRFGVAESERCMALTAGDEPMLSGKRKCGARVIEF